jgi:hypothetical protein
VRRVLIEYLDGDDDMFIVHDNAQFVPEGMALHVIDGQNTGVTRTYPVMCVINLAITKRVIVIEDVN